MNPALPKEQILKQARKSGVNPAPSKYSMREEGMGWKMDI